MIILYVLLSVVIGGALGWGVEKLYLRWMRSKF